MNLKKTVDEHLSKVYILTETIKELEVIKTSASKTFLYSALKEYVHLSKNTRELLFKYIQQERDSGIIPLEYIRLYRKLGDENGQSKN